MREVEGAASNSYNIVAVTLLRRGLGRSCRVRETRRVGQVDDGGAPKAGETYEEAT